MVRWDALSDWGQGELLALFGIVSTTWWRWWVVVVVVVIAAAVVVVVRMTHAMYAYGVQGHSMC